MNTNEKISLTRDVIIISGIFCAFTALLLLINFMQMTRNEPLESEALKALIERLASDPANEALKQDIRNLDLLARKVYFTAQWQVKTGGWLLLCGSVVLGIAVWFNRKLSSRIEKPVVEDYSELPSRLITQKWLLVAGGIVLVLGLAASFFSNNYLKDYQPIASEVADTKSSAVKVIAVSSDESATGEPATLQSEAENPGAQDATILPGTALSAPSDPTETSSGQKPAVKLSFDELKKQHNSFRGAFSQGISYMKNIPVDWDGAGGKNVLWKTPISKSGFNSPVIWGNKIFLSGADDNARVVYCLDRNTGKLLWEKEVSGIPGSPASPPDVTDDTGLAAPTLTVDGRAVYAIFGTGDVIAFDLDGNRLWARNLGVPDNHYGHSSSLLVWDNKLFVQYDTNRGGRLLALNIANGETVWDVKRTNRISWASPILVNMNGNHWIVTSSEPLVAAHDLETGAVLWSLDCMTGEVGPSPAFSEGIVFAANEYAKLLAIQPGASPVILWEDNEYLPEAASPVAHNGLLYLATSYGVVACYDTKTGEKQWEHDAGGGFYSSPVIADGKLYVTDLRGTMYIFAASAEKNLLGTPKLGENTFATPAFSDGRIYLRGERSLFCIGK